MHAQSTFFHQGFDLFDDLDIYRKKVASQVEVFFVILPIRQLNIESFSISLSIDLNICRKQI